MLEDSVQVSKGVPSVLQKYSNSTTHLPLAVLALAVVKEASEGETTLTHSYSCNTYIYKLCTENFK